MAAEIMTNGDLYLTGDSVRPDTTPGDVILVNGAEYVVQQVSIGFGTAGFSARAVPADRLLPVASS